MPNFRIDPFGNFNFLVEIEGRDVAGFQSVTGIEMETAVRDYRTGSDSSNAIRRLSARNSVGTITLERGMDDGKALFKWYEDVKRRGAASGRVPLTLKLRDEAGLTVRAWTLLECWPSKYTIPAMDANADDNAIESVELQCEDVLEL